MHPLDYVDFLECKRGTLKRSPMDGSQRGHNDEILDVAFNANGTKLVTASADGTSRVYNTSVYQQRAQFRRPLQRWRPVSLLMPRSRPLRSRPVSP
jgi:WD40 repeat protein